MTAGLRVAELERRVAELEGVLRGIAPLVLNMLAREGERIVWEHPETKARMEAASTEEERNAIVRGFFLNTPSPKAGNGEGA